MLPTDHTNITMTNQLKDKPLIKIYLSGGIKGLDGDGIHGWRDSVKEQFQDYNIEWKDPSLRKPLLVKEVVEYDKAEIAKCDLVMVKAFPPSWGTAMEIIFAWTNNVPVFAWIESVNESPWIRYHCIKTHMAWEDWLEDVQAYIELMHMRA